MRGYPIFTWLLGRKRAELPEFSSLCPISKENNCWSVGFLYAWDMVGRDECSAGGLGGQNSDMLDSLCVWYMELWKLPKVVFDSPVVYNFCWDPCMSGVVEALFTIFCGIDSVKHKLFLDPVEYALKFEPFSALLWFLLVKWILWGWKCLKWLLWSASPQMLAIELQHWEQKLN